jgi:mono/diheme cytochrome c family protein
MQYSRRIIVVFAIASVLVFALEKASVLAAQVGSVEEGHRLARETCSQCHLLGDERGRSTVEKAPTFRVVANTPGMTSAALRVILVTPHKHMPALTVSGEEADSIVAYILSLKDRAPSPR